jgi:hypothetical protein
MDINAIVAGIGSSQALQDAAAKAGVDPAQAQGMLSGILQHVNDGADLEGMAEGIAGKVGVQPDQVQRFLPLVMGLLQGHSANASEGVQGLLGSLIGAFQGRAMNSLLSGFDTNKSGSIADEAIGLAAGLLGKKQ